MKPVSAILRCSYLCSVNRYLEPNLHWKTKYCKCCGSKYKVQEFNGLRLSEEAKNCKEELLNELIACNLKLDEYNPDYALIMSLIFVLNHSVTQRDLDNLIKITQDAIYEYFNINDSNIFELHVMKVQSHSSSEFVKFIISQSPKRIEDYIY